MVCLSPPTMPDIAGIMRLFCVLIPCSRPFTLNLTMSSLMHIKYTVKIARLLLQCDCKIVDFDVN